MDITTTPRGSRHSQDEADAANVPSHNLALINPVHHHRITSYTVKQPRIKEELEVVLEIKQHSSFFILAIRLGRNILRDYTRIQNRCDFGRDGRMIRRDE